MSCRALLLLWLAIPLTAASPGAQFDSVITEGSSYGIHLLVSIDSFNNVNRSMSRKALTEPPNPDPMTTTS